MKSNNILISKRRSQSKRMGLKVTEMVRIQARLPSGPGWLNKGEKKQQQQQRQTVAWRKISLKCERCQGRNLYIFLDSYQRKQGSGGRQLKELCLHTVRIQTKPELLVQRQPFFVAMRPIAFTSAPPGRCNYVQQQECTEHWHTPVCTFNSCIDHPEIKGWKLKVSL